MSTEDVSASADIETDNKVLEEGKNLGVASNFFRVSKPLQWLSKSRFSMSLREIGSGRGLQR